MKRVHLILLALFAAVSLQAQSVLGIKFGSSYQEVYDALKDQFPSHEIFEDENIIRMYRIDNDVFFFDYALFSFQRLGKASYFHLAGFERYYALNNAKKAKEDRDDLWKIIRAKYANDKLDSLINEDGFLCYRFGTNPKSKHHYLGLLFLNKCCVGEKKKRLILTLTYGPISYIDKTTYI